MFQRLFQQLLSQFGLGYYLPNSSELGMSGSGEPQTDGQAEVAFLPGERAKIEAETEETLDERRQNLTDSSLVWPGKTDTFNYQNDEPVDYRVSLTITDLEPSYYMRRPAIGGQWQQDQSVLLQPGQQTKFEVVFTQPPNVENAARRSFSYVLTLFDPRRANDQGEVVGDVPMRWVPLPKSSDLKIGANPPVVIARPWRRAALFNLEFLNRSQLPPSVSLNILRAENKAKLDTEPEQVATVSQSLPSLTPGVWKIIIPPPAARGSYLATIVGTAKVADGKDYPLQLAKPVFVRYIPWLRAFKDWVFLLGSLFLLLLIVYGIPVRVSPTILFEQRISTPPGGHDSDVIKFLAETEDEPDKSYEAHETGGVYKVALPTRLVGYRPFFGWNNEAPYKFRIKIEPPKDKIYDEFPETGRVLPGGEWQEARLTGVPLRGVWLIRLKNNGMPLKAKLVAGAPEITACDPVTLKLGKGQTLVISGKNFGKRGAVQFSQKESDVMLPVTPAPSQWDASQIKVQVPDSMTLAEGKFTVFVKPEGAETASNGFGIRVTNIVNNGSKDKKCADGSDPPCLTPRQKCSDGSDPPCEKPPILAPKVTGVIPSNVEEGKSQTVTLTGKDFGDSGKVIFKNNGAEIPVTPVWSASSISFHVSALRRGYCSVLISNAAGFSNERRLTVTQGRPIPPTDYKKIMLDTFKDFFIADYQEGQSSVSSGVKEKAKKVIIATENYDSHPEPHRDLYLSDALRSVAQSRLTSGVEIPAVEQQQLAGYLAMCLIKHRYNDWIGKTEGDKLDKLANQSKGSPLWDYAMALGFEWYTDGGPVQPDTDKARLMKEAIHDPAISRIVK